MKLLVVGGGGREHAIIKSLKKNPAVTEIFALPGNGGIAADAVCVPIGATEIDKIVAFAQEQKVDYAVVAPDDPLVLGCVDALEAAKIPCFGPRARAAIIEGSKVFSKNLMKKYGIPTARYEVFDDMAAALAYLDTAPIPTVIKADGLALGKGVIIARTREELLELLDGLEKEAKEYGLIINRKKTRIVKLSSEFRHLQVCYSLTETGRVIRKISPKNITRERRKLKAYKRLLDSGRSRTPSSPGWEVTGSICRMIKFIT